MISEVTDKCFKLRIMKECDSEYTISVVDRSDFAELFTKIDRKGIFLCSFFKGGEVAGYAVFYANDIDNKKAYLTLICMKASAHNTGMGGELLECCICIAKKRGMQSMGLQVLKKDTHVIRFYTKHGFKVQKDLDNLYVRMERKL